MSRPTIAKLWLIGFFVPVVGMIMLIEGLANASGPLSLIGWFVTIVGALRRICAWLRALGYSGRSARWRWFIALLVFGLAGVEIVVMIVFRLATPKDELAGQAVPARA